MPYAVNRDECLSPALCFVADTNTLRKQTTSLGYSDEPFPDDVWCVSTESSLEDSITQNEERRVLASATECGDTCSFLPPNGSHTVREWHELPQVYQCGLHTDIALDVLPVSAIRVAYQSLASVLKKGSFPVHMIDEENQKHRVITVLLKGWQRIGVVEESDERTPRSVQQVRHGMFSFDPEDAVETAQGTSHNDSDIHTGKSPACGRPLVFADKRAQIANALPFNRNHEGCFHTQDDILKGMMLDGSLRRENKRPDMWDKGMVLDGLASSRLRVPVRRAFEILIAQIEKGQNPNEPPDGGKCQIM
ncbi:rheb small monomeric GTPase [Apiospora arundinis]|uniref:Rheb small monomeric GTPase n=1 Tax=Apiospora arundinis TaxID=335852 RepID=A0ABR2IT69_9PEZI